MAAAAQLPTERRGPQVAAATGAVLVLAAVFVAIELASAWVAPYGFFHDELYYWACALRPGLGYVDHPPLAPWMLAVSTAVLGEGVLGFRLVPALCGAATLVLTARMAWRFGADGFGQLLAGCCIAAGPFYLAVFSFYSVNALELLFWTAACWLMVETIHSADERLWVAFGALAGMALLGKHTFLLLVAGLGAGVLATPARGQLRSRWLWAGVGVALLLSVPNLLWNAAHDWPALAFYQSVAAEKNVPTSLSDAFVFQLFGTNPAAFLVWAPGVVFLLFSRAGRPYRPLGVAFAVLLALILVSGQSRGDRIAGIYPVALAAGAAFWSRWEGGAWWKRARWVLPVLILALGAGLAPAAIPVVGPKAVAAYFEALDESPEIESLDAGHAIPLLLLGRLEWERMAGEVFAAWETLPPDDRAKSLVLAPHWVPASVIEFYGRSRSFAPVVSPHNAYWLWREEAAGREVVLSVDVAPEALARDFESTRILAVFRCEHCANWRSDMTIAVSHGPRRPVEELIDEWKHLGSGPSPSLHPGW
jgi:hypothetical protein